MSKKAKTLEVVAIQNGFYDEFRSVGDTFTIRDPEKSFSKRWMLPVDGEAGTAFMKEYAQRKRAAADAITGERIEAGGMAEQLAVAAEESAAKDKEIAALKAQLEAAQAPDENAKEPADTADTADTADAADAADAAVTEPVEPLPNTDAPTNRRRRTRK